MAMANNNRQLQQHPNLYNEGVLQRYATLPNAEAFGGVNRVAEHHHMGNETANNILSHSTAYTLHRQYRRPVKKNPYYIVFKRQQIQADLMDVSSLELDNDGINFLVVTIDCFTRKVRSSVH